MLCAPETFINCINGPVFRRDFALGTKNTYISDPQRENERPLSPKYTVSYTNDVL